MQKLDTSRERPTDLFQGGQAKYYYFHIPNVFSSLITEKIYILHKIASILDVDWLRICEVMSLHLFKELSKFLSRNPG